MDYGASGTSVTATPNAGYHFVSWSDGYPTAARTDMNVMADVNATATFAINTYTLTYTAGANGSITGTTPQTVNYGADGAAVMAVADAGYHFVNWSDASTDNPRTDANVMADITVTANFALNATTVYVDDDWVGTPPGTDPDGPGPATNFGYDSFDTVEGGVAGVAPGGTVIVYAGNYVLATNVAVNKSVSIQGPNIGLSPRNGGGSRVAEAVINGNAGAFNGSSGKTFSITSPATVVTISGFKFVNFDGNLIAEAGGAALTNVDLHQNLFDTNNGGLM